MNKIKQFLFSSSTSIILLLILGFALGTATFIEEKYDTQSARALVYNAIWFEFIFVLLLINFIGHIIRFKMWQKKKWASLLFHSAFILIIIGAAVTRYFGFEGSMHIREGSSTNIIYSAEPYLQISYLDKNETLIYDKPFEISRFGDNSFHAEFNSVDKGKIFFGYSSFIPNAVEKLKQNVPDGKKFLALQAIFDGDPHKIFIEDGKSSAIGNLSISLNLEDKGSSLLVTEKNGQMWLSSSLLMTRTDMGTKVSDTISTGNAVEFR